ncbi:hypothetical protein [Rubritalea halochordaticola]|uniref:hypothetical protein n=1 Tax=Rubritalea halochordaticola TaxID=714537 RepID=UPI0031FD75C5
MDEISRGNFRYSLLPTCYGPYPPLSFSLPSGASIKPESVICNQSCPAGAPSSLAILQKLPLRWFGTVASSE